MLVLGFPGTTEIQENKSIVRHPRLLCPSGKRPQITSLTFPAKGNWQTAESSWQEKVKAEQTEIKPARMGANLPAQVR